MRWGKGRAGGVGRVGEQVAFSQTGETKACPVCAIPAPLLYWPAATVHFPTRRLKSRNTTFADARNAGKTGKELARNKSIPLSCFRMEVGGSDLRRRRDSPRRCRGPLCIPAPGQSASLGCPWLLKAAHGCMTSIVASRVLEAPDVQCSQHWPALLYPSAGHQLALLVLARKPSSPLSALALFVLSLALG